MRGRWQVCVFQKSAYVEIWVSLVELQSIYDAWPLCKRRTGRRGGKLKTQSGTSPALFLPFHYSIDDY